MIYAKYGEIWTRAGIPRRIKAAVEERFHLLNQKHNYIFLIIGIDTSGKRFIHEATTYAHHDHYRAVRDSLPMTVEHHTHKVYGKLAPRHGIWEVQVLGWRSRGILYPNKRYWETIFTGTYSQAKNVLHYATRREKKNIATFQKVYRLKLKGTLRTDGEGRYRVMMGDNGDYFLTTLSFYGKDLLSSRENKRLRKIQGRKYYNEKRGVK